MIFLNFSIFFSMTFSVKPVFPERTISGVCLIFALAVWIFEWMRARFALLGFKSRRVSLLISFITPHKLTVMNGLVGAVTFDIFYLLDSVRTWHMILFPTVFILWYFRAHISTTNYSNKTSNIKPPINKALGFCTTLSILNFDLDNGYVGFGRHFDNS